jgi:creatinine amidohydrolase
MRQNEPVTDRSASYLHELTQPDAERVLAETRTALVVVGSVEQHGPHLPLGTDAVAALAVAERVSARTGAPILLLSLVGVAPYHAPWPGSLTLRPSTLVALLVDVCTGLAAAGARRIVVVNWHEGNTSTLRIAADEAQRAADVRVLLAETHVIANMLFPDEMELTHAGAMETAAVLAWNEKLVQLDRIDAATDFERGSAGHELFRRRDVIPIMRDFREVAASGWYGHPGAVERARAEEILDAVAEHVVARAEEAWAVLES